MAYNCPFDLVLVIDESGSMSGLGDELADDITKAFIEELGTNGRLGFVEFDSSARRIANFAYKGQIDTNRIIQETGARGGTRLSEGLSAGRSMISDARSNRPSFTVAITDVNKCEGFDFAVGVAVDAFGATLGNFKYGSIPTNILTYSNSGVLTTSNTRGGSNYNEAKRIVREIYDIICPQPVEVRCSFNTIIKLNGKDFTPPSQGYVPSSIVLDGVEIGKGSATKNLVQETNHTVVFQKPFHPDYEFTEANPPRIDIKVPYNGGTYNSYFNATEVQRSYLTIKTTYDPEVLEVNSKAEILLNGAKPLNIALPDDPDLKQFVVGTGETLKMALSPGIYTISFKDISIQGMTYSTPKPVTIELKHRDDIVRIFNFEGKFLPKSYWLKPFDDIDKQTIHTTTTNGMFSNSISNLTTFFTSSVDSTVDQYYKHVYHEAISSATSSIQFSIAYGHRLGYGSADEGGQIEDTPSRALYAQYRNILLENSTGSFNLTGTNTDHIYILSFQKLRRDTRADFRDLEINLAHLSGSEYVAGGGTLANHTGSNVQLAGNGSVTRLISSWHSSTIPSVDFGGKYYDMISGSIEDGVSSTTKYGRFYPEMGLVLLDATKLDSSLSFGTTTTREIDGENTHKLFTSISGAAQLTDPSGDLLGMKARSSKDEIINYYYINVRNKEFNFTNNPSFYDSDTGDIISDFRTQPSVYATTVGLYDENRNLLAVAKTSVAEYNSFVDEVMLNVKLKYQ